MSWRWRKPLFYQASQAGITQGLGNFPSKSRVGERGESMERNKEWRVKLDVSSRMVWCRSKMAKERLNAILLAREA